MPRPARRFAPALVLASLALCGCTRTGLLDRSPGPYVVAARQASIHDPVQQRDIALRIAAPAQAGRYPVVVFSHGAFCYPQNYAPVTEHWVTHGYIVIAPDHLDSPNNRSRMTPEQVARLLDSRIRDLTFVADSVEPLMVQAGLGARADTTRMAIAGHSFGGMLAQIKAGLSLKGPGGETVSHADPRFRAAVVMSGVGPMPQMAEGAFAGLRGPLIASGGTLDEGNVGTGQIFPWEWRMSPYTLAPPGDKYSVVLEQGDHYLGGLICREDRGGEDDPEGVAIVRALQVAFLDAYLKDDREARRFLRTADISKLTGSRARFERK